MGTIKKGGKKAKGGKGLAGKLKGAVGKLSGLGGGGGGSRRRGKSPSYYARKIAVTKLKRKYEKLKYKY